MLFCHISSGAREGMVAFSHRAHLQLVMRFVCGQKTHHVVALESNMVHEATIWWFHRQLLAIYTCIHTYIYIYVHLRYTYTYIHTIRTMNPLIHGPRHGAWAWARARIKGYYDCSHCKYIYMTMLLKNTCERCILRFIWERVSYVFGMVLFTFFSNMWSTCF